MLLANISVIYLNYKCYNYHRPHVGILYICMVSASLFIIFENELKCIPQNEEKNTFDGCLRGGAGVWLR